MISQVKLLSDKYFEEILKVRRHLHQNPELSFKEYKTSEFIQAFLKESGQLDAEGQAIRGEDGKKKPAVLFQASASPLNQAMKDECVVTFASGIKTFFEFFRKWDRISSDCTIFHKLCRG